MVNERTQNFFPYELNNILESLAIKDLANCRKNNHLSLCNAQGIFDD